ncbi:TraX family protein [Metabacillus endolithicus]|uniref:TraX family protein n=1 Tax=Metabacillus endolithicus TaxID=1535204 RepID=A0ABW5C629_9BACI|nr:TraX family protein [Metabacillus endolithicus]UPG66262.1 conjugal transfer protein TraX [Metabacillus endolithicus]
MRNDTLKLIAILSMLTDHIGLIFFPQIEFLRVVGRIAFPLFAFGIAVGSYYTKSIKKYAIRLFVFALISTVPHYLVINNMQFNILFTFLVSVIGIAFLKEEKKLYGLLWLLAVPIILPLEYGLYGVWVPVLFYLFRQKKMIQLLLFALVTIFFCLFYSTWIQLFAVPFLLLIFWKPGFQLNLPKYLFYLFYPLHLILLGIFLWFF